MRKISFRYSKSSYLPGKGYTYFVVSGDYKQENHKIRNDYHIFI